MDAEATGVDRAMSDNEQEKLFDWVHGLNEPESNFEQVYSLDENQRIMNAADLALSKTKGFTKPVLQKDLGTRLSRLLDLEKRVSALEQIKTDGHIGYVYFIEYIQEKTVKIGYSKNPKKRLSQLQVGASSDLSLLCAIPGDEDTEILLHAIFGRCRVRGEHFKMTDQICDFATLVNELSPYWNGKENQHER